MISIIIPTHGNPGALYACLTSVRKYTDLAKVEAVVIANGSEMPTIDYADGFRVVWFDKELGISRAYNEGIKNTTGDIIILLDDDCVLLEQNKNDWVNKLTDPFQLWDVGAVSPFAHDYRDIGVVVHSGCTAYSRQALQEIGGFSEEFGTQFFMDNDVSAKISARGYQVIPIGDAKDVNGTFSINFPVYHPAKDRQGMDSKLFMRNYERFYHRNSKFKPESSIIIPSSKGEHLQACIESVISNTSTLIEIIVVANGLPQDKVDWVFGKIGEAKESDVWRLRLLLYDDPMGFPKAVNEGIRNAKGEYIVLMNDDIKILDWGKGTWLSQLTAPLSDKKVAITGPVKFSFKCKDTEWSAIGFSLAAIPKRVFDELGLLDEIFTPGAGEDGDFSIRAQVAGYKIVRVPTDKTVKFGEGGFDIGFPIYHVGSATWATLEGASDSLARNKEILNERWGTSTMTTQPARKVSIVIPTWNHLEELLIPCIDSIERNTSDKYDIEFIFVANGCTDGTLDWFHKMREKNPARYRYHFTAEQIGFTKAANIGFKMATAEHVMILNNDVEIQDWAPKDTWLDKMFVPFDADARCAATGPLKIYDFYSNREFLVGFCVMYRADLLKAFNYFDEAFAPAGGEDVDLAIRLQDGGWKIEAVQKTVYNGSTNTGDFPMWHKDNRSYGQLSEYGQRIVKVNGHLNCKRHNRNIRLNLGGGGINYKGYLNVDLHDKRADILMDISAPMDFASDSVTEILASHLFEHLNPYKALDILKEWLRMLKPGGKLIMEMPDIEKLCARFTAASTGERYGILNAVYGSVNTTGEGDPSEITSPHLFGWWKQSLFDHLGNAGFVDIQFMDEQIPHPESNLRVEAKKAGAPIPTFPTVIIGDTANPRHQVKVEDVVVSTTTHTPEQCVHDEIFGMNVYGVVPTEIKDKVVIDIGAYTGEFVTYAKQLGAKQILAYEVNPSNYQKLYARTKDMSGVATFNAAVYSPDKSAVHFVHEEGLCKVVDESKSPEVPSVTLSKILESFPGDNDLVLKMDCEGSEFPILLTANPEDIRRFGVIYMEIHEKSISGHDGGELVKYLADIGFNPIDKNIPIMYIERDNNGELMKQEVLARTFKFVRSETGPTAYVENPGNPYGVTAYISTKDRYFTTLPLAIMGIASQTFKVDELIIFDDGEQKDLRQESLYANLFRYLEMKGISWRVLFGERKGQVANHQKALELARTEYIWRVDDDNYPESEVLARLMLWLTCPVEAWEQPFGAVGSLVRVPHQDIFPLEKCSGDINKCVDTPNLQWSAFSGVLHTDHLHNTFLFRKSAAKHGYPKDLSPVGHREETMFTHGIKMNGYRLLVCGDVLTWHFRESKGGIRSYSDAKLWEHDEEIFKTEMKKRGLLFDNKKYVVLDNGIGDHYAFKHTLPDLIRAYGAENVVLATCYPEVFKNDGVRQISIAEAQVLFGDLTKFNIYHWMWRSDWKKSIVDAFRVMYIL